VGSNPTFGTALVWKGNYMLPFFIHKNSHFPNLHETFPFPQASKIQQNH